MNELISVVIATYNRTNELKRAIESVLNQTYKNFEIIIIDDNTETNISNEVLNIVKNMNDSKIRLIKNEKNLGGALSRNEGIKESKGNYIAFLDDDDTYKENKLEEQYKLFKNSKNNKLALVYAYCSSIKNGKEDIVYKSDYTGNRLYEAMIGCFAATSQWMCYKPALIDVGCFSDVPCKEDSDLLIKLLAKEYTVDRVPKVLSNYYDEDIPRISSNGNAKKRIDGETHLRKLCRSNYDKLTPQQQKEVEYSFATRLVAYYYETSDFRNYKMELKKIRKTHLLSKKSLEIYRFLVKKRIKRIIFYKGNKK